MRADILLYVDINILAVTSNIIFSGEIKYVVFENCIFQPREKMYFSLNIIYYFVVFLVTSMVNYTLSVYSHERLIFKCNWVHNNAFDFLKLQNFKIKST